MIPQAVISILTNDNPTKAILGTKVYPNVIKQGVNFPYAYVTSESAEKIGCYTDLGIYQGVVQIGVFSDSYATLQNAITAIRGALDNLDAVTSGISIRLMKGVEGADEFDMDTGTHLKTIEYNAVAMRVS